MEEQQRSQRDVKLIQKYTIPDKDPLAPDFFDHDHVLDPVTLKLF